MLSLHGVMTKLSEKKEAISFEKPLFKLINYSCYEKLSTSYF